MKKQIAVAALVALVGAGSAWAGNLTVPHSFTAGQKAVAAEVNANFSATENAVRDNFTRTQTNASGVAANDGSIQANTAAINTNASAISALGGGPAPLGPVQILSNGVSIGTYLHGYSGDLTRGFSLPVSINNSNLDLTRIAVGITDNMYVFSVAYYGSIRGATSILYASSDCSGQGYLLKSFANEEEGQQGLVLATDSGNGGAFGPLVYIPNGSVTATVTIQSQLFNGNCIAAVGTDQYWPALPNDPAVTGLGIDPGAIALPITLGWE